MKEKLTILKSSVWLHIKEAKEKKPQNILKNKVLLGHFFHVCAIWSLKKILKNHDNATNPNKIFKIHGKCGMRPFHLTFPQLLLQPELLLHFKRYLRLS